MLSEKEKIHVKISKQKFKIQFMAFLHKFTKNHLIDHNVI